MLLRRGQGPRDSCFGIACRQDTYERNEEHSHVLHTIPNCQKTSFWHTPPSNRTHEDRGRNMAQDAGTYTRFSLRVASSAGRVPEMSLLSISLQANRLLSPCATAAIASSHHYMKARMRRDSSQYKNSRWLSLLMDSEIGQRLKDGSLLLTCSHEPCSWAKLVSSYAGDGSVIVHSRERGAQMTDEARMQHWIWLLVAFRAVTALCSQTCFIPDEYWQGPEVAHRLVFGYGGAQITLADHAQCASSHFSRRRRALHAHRLRQT